MSACTTSLKSHFFNATTRCESLALPYVPLLFCRLVTFLVRLSPMCTHCPFTVRRLPLCFGHVIRRSLGTPSCFPAVELTLPSSSMRLSNATSPAHQLRNRSRFPSSASFHSVLVHQKSLSTRATCSGVVLPSLRDACLALVRSKLSLANIR